MNKIIIFISIIVSMCLVDGGMSTKTRANNLMDEYSMMQKNNREMKQKIKNKLSLVKRKPVLLSREYGMVINQIRILESYSGTNMHFQLEGAKDVNDMSGQYVGTIYKGVRGLRVKIVVDKFSKETDMGAVLDDINLLEKNTDFAASEISKDNDNLIIKGEIYGI